MVPRPLSDFVYSDENLAGELLNIRDLYEGFLVFQML